MGGAKLQHDGRGAPAVAVFGRAKADWLRSLQASLPADAVCYVAGSDAIDGFKPLGFDAARLEDNFAALLKAEPQRDWITLKAGVSLPQLWFERLHKARNAIEQLGAVAPLSNLDPQTSPLPSGASLAPKPSAERIDRLAYVLGQRSYFDTDTVPGACAWWAQAGLKTLAEKDPRESITGRLQRAGLRAVILDHLYADDPDLPLQGPPAEPDPDRRAPAHPLTAVRQRILDALSAASPETVQLPGLTGQPVLLHVSHSWGGGVERFISDLIAADTGRQHLVLTARGQSDIHSFGQTLQLHAGTQETPVIREWRLPTPIHSTTIHTPAYRAILDRIIDDFSVDQILVSSLIGHSLDVLDSALPTALVLHDYYPVCPALNIYFDEVCPNCRHDRLKQCLRENPFNRLFVDKDAEGWLELRDAYVNSILARKHAIAVPSDSVRANITRIEPRLKKAPFAVIPHGLSAWPPQPTLEHAPSAETRLRLVVAGRLKSGKGRDLLRRALPDLRQVADIWLLGCGKEAHEFLGERGVHLIFDYQREHLPEILSNIQPHAGMLLSTVPETFGYTLSELFSLGVPVIATNKGAFSERIDHGQNGLLIDDSPQSLIAAVKRLATEHDLLRSLQVGAARTEVSGLGDMARAYGQLLKPPERAACRYTLRAPGPDLLVENALREQLSGARVELQTTQQALSRHKHELLERASWGYRLQKQLDQRAKELAARATQVKELEQERDERTAWARALDEKVTALDEELARVRAHAHAQVQGLEQALRDSRQKFDDILQTRSWRWTKPLRSFTTWLRRLRDGARFRLGRWRTLSRRTRESLNGRGVSGTISRIGREPAAKRKTHEAPANAARPDPGPLVIETSDNPHASIIIPAFNHAEMTFACLHSIAANTSIAPFEVIVVDDASEDNTPDMLAQVEGIRVQRQAENAGFIAACNEGACVARGRFLIFLNNDTTVTRGWLDQLLLTFDQHADAWVAGAKLVYPDGRLQEAGGIVFSDASGWNYGRDDRPDNPAYNFVREVDYCSGACIAIRKTHFDELGGFDTAFAPAYYEDTDLAFKVREAGGRVYYQPASTVIHHEGATSGTDVNQGIKRYQRINHRKFQARWRRALARQPLPGTAIRVARQHRLRGRILIVDAVVPQADQDSGSLRMVNLIALLRSLNFGVSFMPANLTALEPYTSQLQQAGVEMLHLPWLASPPSWLADNGRYFDVVILSRHYVAKEYIWQIKRHCPKARILFDTVDLHFLRAERLSQLSHTAVLTKSAARTRKDELNVARQADMTLVVSPFEQTYLKEHAPELDVRVLSNIHHIYGRRKPFEERRDIWFVGGFQHPPNIDAMIWFAAEVWPLIAARLPDVTFHIVGSKTVSEIERLAGENVKVHGYVPNVEPFLDGCRLAVAPLRYGAGVKGKLNQSMAYGQPVVATSAAVEGMYVKAGKEVLVADNTPDFAAQVIRLYDDADLWQRLSDNGLENVRRYFSFDAARAALTEILDVEPVRKSSKSAEASRL